MIVKNLSYVNPPFKGQIVNIGLREGVGEGKRWGGVRDGRGIREWGGVWFVVLQDSWVNPVVNL